LTAARERRGEGQQASPDSVVEEAVAAAVVAEALPDVATDVTLF
jgi:hypothetical protein